MITLRQLEALHFIVQLGTYERAAERLHLTQSTISKRIQELEAATGVTVFERHQRGGSRLTEKGEHVLALAREMLALQGQLASIRHAGFVPERTLRVGVTELAALTWLPRLVTAVRQEYPSVQIEPKVATTRELHAWLHDEIIDLIVVPETDYAPHLASLRVAEVANAWMARPGLVQARKPIALADLTGYPLLALDTRSGAGQFYNRLLKRAGLDFPHRISCDNLTALVGLTVAGLGVCILPHQCFRTLSDDDKLEVIATEPPLPPIPYSVIYRTDRPTSFNETIAGLIKGICDFTRQLQS